MHGRKLDERDAVWIQLSETNVAWHAVHPSTQWHLSRIWQQLFAMLRSIHYQHKQLADSHLDVQEFSNAQLLGMDDMNPSALTAICFVAHPWHSIDTWICTWLQHPLSNPNQYVISKLVAQLLHCGYFSDRSICHVKISDPLC